MTMRTEAFVRLSACGSVFPEFRRLMFLQYPKLRHGNPMVNDLWDVGRQRW